MTDQIEPPKTDLSVEEQKALSAYQAAMQMWAHSGQVLWSKFNAMLVANSIVVACLIFGFDVNKGHIFLRLILPLIGFLLCIAWIMITARGNALHTYYFFSAREIAEHYFRNEVKFQSERGQIFADGASVRIELTDDEITRRIPFLGRIFSTETLSYIIIVIFGGLHLSFFWYALWA